MSELDLPDGIEQLDTDIEDAHEEAEAIHLQHETPVEIEIGNVVGNTVYTETEYFVVMSVTAEADEVQEMMTGESYIDESSVFISNADGDVGGGIIQIDDGNLQDAVDEFAGEEL